MSQELTPASVLAREAEERDLSPEELAGLRPFVRVIFKLRNLAVSEKDGAFEIAALVIDEIAVAESVEDVFAANERGPAGADENLEVDLGVYDAKFWRSAEKFREGTLGYYVAMSFIRPNKELGMVTVGASNVVASALRLMELNAITGDVDKPCWVKIHGRETANGTLYILQGGSPPPF